VNDTIVDLPIEVSTGSDRVSSHDFLDSDASSRCRRTVEVGREPAVPEEGGSGGHVEFLIIQNRGAVPSVDEEVECEHGFAVPGEVAREDVGEILVGGDSFLG
jgi:hypothetical protein